MFKTNLTALVCLLTFSAFAQNGWFVVTPRGDRLAWVEATELSPAGDLIKIKKGSKYGLMDVNGNLKIKPKYRDIKGYSNGLVCLKASNGKYGYMTEKGYFPIEAQYDDATNFNENGIAAVKNRGEWGYIDRLGKLLIDYNYIDATPFKDGYAIVRKTMSKTSGIINTRNQYIVKPGEYLQLMYPSDGMIASNKQGSGKWGFLDMRGKTVINHRYKKVTPFHEGHALVSTGNKYGVINKQGEATAAEMFEAVKPDGYNDGLAAVMYKGKWGFVNYKGEIVIDFIYEDVSSFSDGKAAVYQDGWWGYIDTYGEMVIIPEFAVAGGFYRMNGQSIALAKEGEAPPPLEDEEYDDQEAMIVDEIGEDEEEEDEEETYYEEDMEEEYEEEETTGWNNEEVEEEEEKPKSTLPSTRPGRGRDKDKGKRPKNTSSSTATAAPNTNAVGGEEEVDFVIALHTAEQKISEARMKYTASLVYTNMGHSSGNINTFSKSAKVARREMDDALDALGDAKRQLSKARRYAGDIQCGGLERPTQSAVSALAAAAGLLNKASRYLDNAFSKSDLKSMNKTIQQTSTQLDKTLGSIRDIQFDLEECLTE